MLSGYQNFQPNPYMGGYGNFNNYNMPPAYSNRPPMNYMNNIQGGYYGNPPKQGNGPPQNNVQVP